MALRLTRSSLAPDDARGAANGANGATVDPTAALAALAAHADAALAAGDMTRYRALFHEAARHEDHNRAYHATKTMLERGLAATSHQPPKRCAEIFAAVAEAAIESLEHEPREPVLLNYAGVAMYELWSLEAARALFLAAERLDPELPYLRRNLAGIRRRRRTAGPNPQQQLKQLPLHRALPTLARRATAVSAAAKPKARLTLSLCMIVRDEAEMLPRCLAAVAPAVDEIIVVDTGSRDATIEIARSYGARVIEREWTGSFSEARNVSFDAATCDWVMYLDADEVLIAEDVDRLRAVTGRTWREAFYLSETNFTGGEGDGTGISHKALRIFRNRPEYRFEGRLHEQIAQHLPSYVPERLEYTSVRIEHFGYLGAVRDAKEKSRRNIELLKVQQAESPPTPFLHFNLGSEYAAAGDHRAALDELEKAWMLIEEEGDGGAGHEFTPSLIARRVKALRLCGRNEDALTAAREGLERFPPFTDLVFEQAVASIELGREPEAISYYRRCIDMGDAPARFCATLGTGTYLPRLALATVHMHHGELEPARELLDWCLENHPGFFGTVQPYAAALLRAGRTADEVTAEIERRVTEVTPTVRFVLGRALYEAGAVEAAEPQFRLVLAAQPHNSQARVALAEAILYQRRYLDAAAEAAALPEGDPLAPLASRTELIGTVVARDAEKAQAAVRRAARVGVPGAERELFEACIAILIGGEPALDGLSIASTPLLLVLLELLLQVGDFETLEALHPLLERSALPRREQRELLGSMYLRRGFLKSAAQEWLAVCSEQPDARALAGLARIAAAQGMGEDARTFAAEALALDPGNANARAVLTRHPPSAPVAA
jgi:tetratricopeptide (TPR) repeat protein